MPRRKNRKANNKVKSTIESDQHKNADSNSNSVSLMPTCDIPVTTSSEVPSSQNTSLNQSAMPSLPQDLSMPSIPEQSVVLKSIESLSVKDNSDTSNLAKSVQSALEITTPVTSAVSKLTEDSSEKSPPEPSTISKSIENVSESTNSTSSMVPQSNETSSVKSISKSSNAAKSVQNVLEAKNLEPSVVSKPAQGLSAKSTSVSSTITKSVQISSQNSNTTMRSSSAFPISQKMARSSSMNKSTTVSERPRSQSTRSTRGRRYVCSAVPDTAVLCPVRRPDDGGSMGKPISVYTNHFRVEIDNALINQYDIEIVSIASNGKERPARKDERWETIQCIIKQRKNFPLVWYDDGKTLYTRALLSDINEPIQVKIKKNEEIKTFQLKILNLVRQDKIERIFDFINKKTISRPRETVQIIETLFKQRARNELVCVRNQFYDRNQILDDLKDGRGMAKGFYQSLFLTRSGPTLNVNLTFTCFYMPLNFIEFASKYLRKDIRHGLSEYETKEFKKLIRDLLVETKHAGHCIRYKFRGFGRSPNDLKFTCDRRDAETTDLTIAQEISVNDYFKQKYNIVLKHPDLPCIDARSGNMQRANWLPMEVVYVVEWQRSLKPLDKTQRNLVSRKTIIKPLDRYEQIMNIMRTRDFQTDVYLKDLNVRVDNREMLQIPARILQPPDIQYRPGQRDAIASVNVGKWRINNHFYTTPEIRHWGVIHVGESPNSETDEILQTFVDQLPELLKRKGFVIRSKLILTKGMARKTDVESALVNARKNHWDLVIVVLNTVHSSQVYDYVKHQGHQKFGLRIQCVDMEALKKNRNSLHMYVDNLSQKINGRLGGINSIVNTKLALSRSSKEDLFMFFGADVTHSTSSTDRPSVAAVVASREPTNTLYAARICKQYPKKGRCSIEIIKELDQMVIDLLRVFENTCGGRLPNKIVFYRDGVDEGQYQKVLDNEVTKIKDACRIVYRNQPLPKLTFLVVKKRHNTRFFLYDGRETLNVQPGTVIDKGITHPSQFDFYLCSQAAILGTSRPTLYHVLHDDIGFSSDDIQQLTYWLCHTDMRCTKSVSIPAPVHYAHLAAYASRSLKFEDHTNTLDFDDENDPGENDDEEPTNYSLEDITTKLMVLDQSIEDDMWFI